MAQEIFKLVGKIVIDADEAKQKINDTTDTADQAGSRMSGAFSKIGSAMATAGKVIVTGMAAAATAIGFVTKQSVEAYANYEQLVGGIETLFGAGGMSLQEYATSVGKTVDQAKGEYDKLIAAQNAALENADNAWQKQGMSANQYMETVTSFSASLIQSLGGDTQEAVKVADIALTDMADNANKMGTDMELIQNAYQGFAKQNFDMLDNLKLGYGGTKTEMQRLLSDAEKIKRANGEMADYSIDSFADMVEAIHVIQDEMGVTGTTAKEAATTIQGSASAMKAAWENFLVGLADPDQDMGALMDNLAGSIETFASNVLPRIQNVFAALPQALTTLIPTIVSFIASMLPTLITSAAQLIAGLISSLPSLISQIATAIAAQAPQFIQTGKQLLSQLGTGITQGLPLLMSKGQEMLHNLGEGIRGAMPDIISKGLDLLNGFVDTLVANVPKLINMGADFVKQLVQGLMDSLPTIIQKAPEIITKFANMISSAVPQLLVKGAEIIWEIIKGIIGAIPDLIANIPKIFEAILAVWNAINWLNLGKTLVTGIWNGIKNFGSMIKDGVSNLFNQLKTNIDNIFTNIKTSASNIWNGIKTSIGNVVNGIKTTVSNIFNGVKTTVSNIWNGIKTTISNAINGAKTAVSSVVNGIKSTVSSVFNSVKSTVSSVWNGIKDAITSPIETAKNTVKGIIDKIKGFFNFSISWPHIPLPHFSIKPKGWSIGDLLKGSIPSLGIDWYAKGGILEKPTVFGISPNGNAMVGGEAGKEAVAPISELMDYVRAAVAEQNAGMADVLNKIFMLLRDYVTNMGNEIILDTGVLVGQIAPQMDESLGKIKDRKGRKR